MDDLYSILDSLEVIVFVHEAKTGKVLYVNKACEQAYGFTQEQLLEGGLLILYDDPSFDFKKGLSLIQKAAAGEKQVFEWRTAKSNGEVFWVEVTLSAMEDDSDRVIATVRDIAIRRDNRKQLEINERFQKTINTIIKAIFPLKMESDVLWSLAESCGRELGLEDLVIYMYNNENQLIQSAAFGDKAINNRQISNPIVLSIDDGIVGSVARNKKSEIVNNLEKDTRYIPDNIYRKSEITVPIFIDDKLLGVIDSEHSNFNYFSKYHLEILETVASLAAIKIEQSRSYERENGVQASMNAILNTNPDLVFILSDEGRYLEIYTKNQHMLAAPKEQLIGTLIDHYLDDMESERIKEMLNKLVKSGLEDEIEYQRKSIDGKYRWFSTKVSRIEYKGNTANLLMSRDITQNKNIQRKIKENERLLAAINKNISEGLYRSYSEGGLIYANNAFAKMFGYKNAKEILKVKSLDLYANPVDRKGETPEIIKTGYRSNIETLFKRKDGSTFWGLNSFVLIKDHNGKNVFDGAIRDISSEKAAADELNNLNAQLFERNKILALKEQELESSNEELRSNRDSLVQTLKKLSDRNFELDQLVYKTSHDLRAPLRSVLGLTNLMKIENSEFDVDYIHKIDERILKMDDFIKSMLDYSKASRMEVERKELDVELLINECLADLEYLEGYNEIAVETKFSNGIKMVTTDVLRNRIIFANIISNAFKYRNTSIEDSYLKIAVSINEDRFIVVFEDNGIGISKEYLGQVFDMFFRATEKSDGSGLGMYIVKQCVDKLHGTIEIDSKLGAFAKFTIVLPL